MNTHSVMNIEKNIPIPVLRPSFRGKEAKVFPAPPKKRRKTSKREEILAIIRSLNFGDSFVLAEKSVQSFQKLANMNNIRLIRRSQNNGKARLWRIKWPEEIKNKDFDLAD